MSVGADLVENYRRFLEALDNLNEAAARSMISVVGEGDEVQENFCADFLLLGLEGLSFDVFWDAVTLLSKAYRGPYRELGESRIVGCKLMANYLLRDPAANPLAIGTDMVYFDGSGKIYLIQGAAVQWNR